MSQYLEEANQNRLIEQGKYSFNRLKLLCSRYQDYSWVGMQSFGCRAHILYIDGVRKNAIK